jgi:hypothetical protein
MHPATNGPSSNTIARRDANGGCQFEDPTYAKDAVNKRTLESAIANFLVADKSTSNFSYRTYIIRSTGQQQVMRATSGKSENTFVMRDANGCSQFNTPVGANDAATKNYVDTEIQKVIIPDLTAYATTDYVEDNFVASSSAEFQEKLSYDQAEQKFLKIDDAENTYATKLESANISYESHNSYDQYGGTGIGLTIKDWAPDQQGLVVLGITNDITPLISIVVLYPDNLDGGSNPLTPQLYYNDSIGYCIKLAGWDATDVMSTQIRVRTVFARPKFA